MSTSTAAIPSTAPSVKPLERFAWVVLAYNIAVVLWGAAVRATGSGAGCGEHWPLCNGTLVQHHPAVATMIELAHRASSGVALFAIIALLVWTFRATAKWHMARAMAVAALILTLNEALLGALLVLLGKVAHDQSASRGVYLGLHLTNTLLLLGALTLTAHFLARHQGFMRGGIDFRSMKLAITGLTATLIVGVTGSLAALGDTLYPAHSLREAFAQDFAASSSWLLRLRWVHPAISLVAGAFIVWLVAWGLQEARNRGLAFSVIGLLLLQYLLGVADVVLLTPTWLQMTHLLGADLLWCTLIVLAARICVRPMGCPGLSCKRS